MELYEAWKRRKWRKFTPGSEPFRAGGGCTDEFTLTQEDVLVENNLLRARELQSLHKSKETDRFQKSSFEVEPGHSSQQLSLSKQGPLSQNDSHPNKQALGEAEDTNSLNSSFPASMEVRELLGFAAKEVEMQRQEERIGWKVYQNSSTEVEMENLGGTRHILKDFQDQLKTLRAQIALLSAENGDLQHELLIKDSNLRLVSESKQSLEEELGNCQRLLQNAQGDLKLSKNREIRLQKLQETFKQLMEEKDSRLSNSSINSRAVIEQKLAMQSRIEDLESRLVAAHDSRFAHIDANGNHANGRKYAKEDSRAVELGRKGREAEGQSNEKASRSQEVFDALSCSHDQLKNECLELRRQLQTVSEDCQNHVARNDQLQDLVLELQRQKALDEARLSKLQDEQLAKAHELQQSRSAEFQQHAQLSDLSIKHSQLEKEHQSLQEIFYTADKTAKDLALECERRAQAHAETSRDLSAARDEHGALTEAHRDLESLHTTIVVAHAAAVSTFESRLTDRQHQIEELESACKDLTTRASHAESCVLSLKAQLEENLEKRKCLMTENSFGKRDFEVATAQLLTVEAELKKAVDQNCGLSNKIKEAEQTAVQLQSQVASLNAELDQLTSEAARKEQHHFEVVHSQQAELLSRKQSSLQQIQQLKEAEDECRKLAAEVVSLIEAKAATAERLNEIEGLLASEATASRTAALSADAANKLAEELQAKLTAAEARVATALAAVEDEQAVTRGVLEEAQGRGFLVEQLQRDLDASLAEVEFHQEHCAEHARAAEELEKQIQVLHADLDAQKEHFADHCKTTKAAAEAAAADAAKLKSLLATAKAENMGKSQEMEALVRQKEAAVSEALAAKQATASLGIDLANAQDRLAAQLALASSEEEAARAQRQALADQIQDLEASHSLEISTLGEEMEILKLARTEADVALDAVQSYLESHKQAGLQLQPFKEDNLDGNRYFTPDPQLTNDSNPLSKLQSEVVLLAQQKSEAERQAIAHKSAADELQGRQSAAAAAQNAMAAQLRESQAALSELQASSRSHQKQTSDLTAELSKARAELGVLNDHVALAAAQNSAQYLALSTEAGRWREAAAEAAADAAAARRLQEEGLREAEDQKKLAEQLQATLNATHQSHQLHLADLQAVVDEMRDAPERHNAALSFELWRLIEENDMLRARVQDYEADVQKLVNDSEALGHSNTKQKIQYHLRWKQDLEELRTQCTVLLRERFQLEQCVRYLAVRCGLSIAVERDVTASKERTPLDKLQPASLVPHYKFAGKAAHVTDAAGDHVMLEDLADDVGDKESVVASERGSISTALSNKPDHAVEQQILARVAFVCNASSNKLADSPLRPVLTSRALLALPAARRAHDAVRDWTPGSKGNTAKGGPPQPLHSADPLSSAKRSLDFSSSPSSSLKEEDGEVRLQAFSSGRSPKNGQASMIPKPRISPRTSSAEPSPASERSQGRLTNLYSKHVRRQNSTK